MTNADQLSRRERQIMDILYRLGQASAKEVMENMDDAPSYS
ncbi:MAG: BlaI/MecI/CopY family transcriptional regulator, partial [Pseudohongiella sp.]|nr:BlaI/MecI/CopY family transcriptional regulator [Pseudohongiella sp.]